MQSGHAFGPYAERLPRCRLLWYMQRHRYLPGVSHAHVGSGQGSQSVYLMGLGVGSLIEHRSSAGIARVAAVDEARLKIEYFESAAEPAVDAGWLPTSECRHVPLQAQTRVFCHDLDTGEWRAGRIVAGQPPTYYVRFPNSELDVAVPEADLRVRWDRPVRNPVEVLIAAANESPYFRDARLPLLQNLVAQRAACSGMTALLSSAIEIHPHQVHAAMTVLSDPVQRYLLADEVGLGKTIEAGLIVRQTFLDRSISRVAVVAPDILRGQWQSELKQKFFVDDFPDATLRISSHETPDRWRQYHGFDLLVVDEAHRLVQTEDPADSPYRELAALAQSVPRILLLSATPATARPITHLGLLHLLDSDLYRWEDRKAFTKRFDARKELAHAVYALDAEFEYLLGPTIEQIEALLPGDPLLRDLGMRVLDFLTKDGDLVDEHERAALTRVVEGLRAHIGETYRLHRRMIRHRRSLVLTEDDNAVPFEVRGRTQPRELALPSAEHESAQEALLEWQTGVADWLYDHDDPGGGPAYARVLSVLVSRAGGPVDDLVSALRWRVHGDDFAAQRAGLSATERLRLRLPVVLAPENAVLAMLEEARSSSGAAQLAEALAPLLRGVGRAVVCCGPGALAPGLRRELHRRLPPMITVGEHTEAAGARACGEAVATWKVGGGVLVVDETAEDGLNLQLADIVVHCRLPASPNQFEQRLGRVDRYVSPLPGAPASPVAQYVLGHTEGVYTLSGAWRSLLVDGYGVFDGSLSALQEAVEFSLDEVWSAGLERGPSGLTGCAPQTRDRLNQERRDVDAADLLESVHGTMSDTADPATATTELETDWQQVENAVIGYAGSGPGGLRLRAIESNGPRVLRFDLPSANPLLPPRMFARSGRVLSPELREGAFNRNVALRQPGTRVFRSGHPFVDLLGTIIAIDDRGQASAFWRRDLHHGGDPEVYFGIDFLVEASFRAAAELVDRSAAGAQHALRRQADHLFSPFVRRVWVPALAGSALDDPRKTNWLNRRYDPRRGDVNLNADRIPALFDLFGGRLRFVDAANHAAKVARRDLDRVTDLAARSADAAQRARRQLGILQAQARARHAAGGLVGDADGYVLDVALTEAFVADLADPTATIVGATCLVRGGPEQVHHGD
jgi:ATP-dependent helicase HepA